VLALDERELSNSLTAVMMDGSDEVRRVTRIGHLGDFDDLMLAGTLSGVQMGLKVAGHDVGDGVGAALELLAA
jgi:alanine-glyoxylate transaminase/serine-glyoxylate transaminase/serine-pyruvate transaminase